jgi:hypothetical protein
LLEPDHTARVVPTQTGAPGRLGSPHALQILTTEHWSLLAARSLVYTEAMSRASIFIAALSGSVIALALVGQATEFGRGFVAFALVLLPVVFFLGVSTVFRLSQVNFEDATWVQGMNRIRHAYLELAPELEPYFVTGTHDDEAGMLLTAVAMRDRPPSIQPFVAIPGVVAVVDSVVAGAVAGIAAHGLDLAVGWVIALGAATFLVVLACFVVWARREVDTYRERLEPRFPTPS